MMFVSGELQNTSILLTNMIEDMVKQEVIKILSEGLKLAINRKNYSFGQMSNNVYDNFVPNVNSTNLTQSGFTGSNINLPPMILPEDIIFLMRHDRSQVSRLRTYLLWKDLRKNNKDKDKELTIQNDNDTNGNKDDKKDNAKEQGIKRTDINLPWELLFMFTEQPLNDDDQDDKMDDLDREEILKSQKKLKQADERTLKMTQKEYVHWSECRQASFTFRKAKRFKEWCGFSNIQEKMGYNPNGAGGGKLSDDVIDILGFITFDMVCNITELGIKLMKQEEHYLKSQIESSDRGLFGKGSALIELDLRPRHIIGALRELKKTRFGKSAIRNFSQGRKRHKKMAI
ncbi:related to Protein SPT3 [Hanseniaspora guilliermondii]|uniref:Related to Protein SPT3 n=1 Tax=Hanseniaspora guilliermondii TaxID=56406 RepID=A0A1L0B159_9ASCO|nr:related to Protein SPT3 [Hanseniaspora guilliermondii]